MAEDIAVTLKRSISLMEALRSPGGAEILEYFRVLESGIISKMRDSQTTTEEYLKLRAQDQLLQKIVQGLNGMATYAERIQQQQVVKEALPDAQIRGGIVQ